MNDPIAKKFDEEWTPYVVNEPSIAKVRTWLKGKDEADIRLYLSTFEETLNKQHKARAALLREELERRMKPPPDRVKDIIVALRANWIVAVLLVVVLVVGGLSTFKESWCKLVPWTPFVCVEKTVTLKTIFPGGSK